MCGELKSDHFGIEINHTLSKVSEHLQLKSDHFGIEIKNSTGIFSGLATLKSDHFGIEIVLYHSISW